MDIIFKITFELIIALNSLLKLRGELMLFLLLLITKIMPVSMHQLSHLFCQEVDVQSHFTRLLFRPLLFPSLLPFRGRARAAAFSCVRPTMQLPFCPFSKVSQFCHFHFAKREQERARGGATQAGLGRRVAVESVTRPTHGTMPQCCRIALVSLRTL